MIGLGHILGIPVEESLPALVPVGAVGVTFAAISLRRRITDLAARAAARIRRTSA